MHKHETVFSDPVSFQPNPKIVPVRTAMQGDKELSVLVCSEADHVSAVSSPLAQQLTMQIVNIDMKGVVLVPNSEGFAAYPKASQDQRRLLQLPSQIDWRSSDECILPDSSAYLGWQ